MNQIRIESTESGLNLLFPYHEEAKNRIKNIGGRWNGYDKCWTVKPEMEQEARQILIDAFGTDGTVEVKTLTVKVVAKRDVWEYGEPVTCCGKVLARAWGRDSGAKVGDDVALLGDGITSGGSRKNWKTIVHKGATFKLVNVLPARLDEYDEDDFEVTVIEGEEVASNPLAAFSDDDILAEAKRRGLI